MDVQRFHQVDDLCETNSFVTTVEAALCDLATLGPTKSDNINRLIILTDYFYLIFYIKWDAKM